MNREQALHLAKYVDTSWPSQTFTPEQQARFADLIGDQDYELAKRAIWKCIQNDETMPNVARIRSMVRQSTPHRMVVEEEEEYMPPEDARKLIHDLGVRLGWHEET